MSRLRLPLGADSVFGGQRGWRLTPRGRCAGRGTLSASPVDSAHCRRCITTCARDACRPSARVSSWPTRLAGRVQRTERLRSVLVSIPEVHRLKDYCNRAPWASNGPSPRNHSPIGASKPSVPPGGTPKSTWHAYDLWEVVCDCKMKTVFNASPMGVTGEGVPRAPIGQLPTLHTVSGNFQCTTEAAELRSNWLGLGVLGGGFTTPCLRTLLSRPRKPGAKTTENPNDYRRFRRNLRCTGSCLTWCAV